MLTARLQLMGAVLLLAACSQDPQPTDNLQTNAAEDADFARMATAGRMLPDLRVYLDGDDPAPRTFTFDRLIFVPGSDTIRAVDEQTLLALSHTLKTHGNARVRVVGFGDGTGTNDNSRSLGLQRAKAVARYLQGTGLRPGRVEAAAGREARGTRPTQLVVLKK